MKAVISPRHPDPSQYWYAPFAGQTIEVTEQPLGDWYGVLSKPLCDAQNIDPFIHKDDLTFLEDESQVAGK